MTMVMIPTHSVMFILTTCAVGETTTTTLRHLLKTTTSDLTGVFTARPMVVQNQKLPVLRFVLTSTTKG